MASRGSALWKGKQVKMLETHPSGHSPNETRTRIFALHYAPVCCVPHHLAGLG
jgi:hypothetical protein